MCWEGCCCAQRWCSHTQGWASRECGNMCGEHRRCQLHLLLSVALDLVLALMATHIYGLALPRHVKCTPPGLHSVHCPHFFTPQEASAAVAPSVAPCPPPPYLMSLTCQPGLCRCLSLPLPLPHTYHTTGSVSCICLFCCAHHSRQPCSPAPHFPHPGNGSCSGLVSWASRS